MTERRDGTGNQGVEPAFPHLPLEAWTLFLADALPDAAAMRLERHLSECTECRQALEKASRQDCRRNR